MAVLSRYKKLIDRTEELRKGQIYSYSDVDLTAKVVDIPTRIYDRNNEIIGEFFEQKREIVPFSYIPEWLVKGVIASEDREFYRHNGISYKGILRAFFVNIAHFGVAQGGSTVTQQLGKVLFTDMVRSLKRKVYETFSAIDIEKLYDKQDIMSMYLNLIYFGNGAYGVESAAKMFFGTSVKSLSEVECAMIVATISSPRIYSPLLNLNNSVKKTRRILESLVDAGYLKSAAAEYRFKQFIKKWDIKFDGENRALSSLIGRFVYSTYRVNRSPFFNESIRRILVRKFGEEVVKKGGLTVYTTIEAEKQDAAVKSLRLGIENQRNYHSALAKKLGNSKNGELELRKSKKIEGALVSMNPESGEIISYAGGYEFTVSSQLDHVEQVERSPGSSIKPVIYAAAIENRDITASTIFVDEKTVFKGGYAPSNYDSTFEGRMIVREALRKSVNIVAVKVLEKTGYDRSFEIIQKSLDLPGDEFGRRFRKTLSFALGAYELSPLENAVLHSTIVNGGKFVKPYGIRFVKDYNGNIVWNNEEAVQADISEARKRIGKIIDPVSCSIILSILIDPPYSPLQGRKFKFDTAAKTGTSSNHNDAWVAGYVKDMVTVVWIGNSEGAISLGNGRSGGIVAVPVWANYLAEIYRKGGPGNFALAEDGISRERICLDSGEVAGKNGECPRVFPGQLYYSGTEPGRYCRLHVKEEAGDKTSAPGR